MLENKDFELILKHLEVCDDTKNVIEKLNLLIEANNVKNEADNKMIEIQTKLRKLYDEEHSDINDR